MSYRPHFILESPNICFDTLNAHSQRGLIRSKMSCTGTESNLQL